MKTRQNKVKRVMAMGPETKEERISQDQKSSTLPRNFLLDKDFRAVLASPGAQKELSRGPSNFDFLVNFRYLSSGNPRLFSVMLKKNPKINQLIFSLIHLTKQVVQKIISKMELTLTLFNLVLHIFCFKMFSTGN